MGLLDVSFGLDLTFVQGADSGAVKVKSLLAGPVLGFALVSVPVALPTHVAFGFENLTLMPLIDRLTEVPLAVGAETVQGRACAVTPAQAVLPEKLAAVTVAAPLLSVSVKLAVHGIGMPATVAVVGPDNVALPVDTQALPFQT